MPLAVLNIDILGDVERCGPDCPPFLAKWAAWCIQFEGKNLALIKVDDYYYDNLDRKSRAMVRKAADRGYAFEFFNYNDHLQDIYEINTSKERRQGKVMTAGYLEYPLAISSQEPNRCEAHQYLRIGALKDGKLRAYCAMAILNELAVLNTIIGHADALPDGVMNGLIEYLVRICDVQRVKYLNYLTMESSGESLQAFKASVGFESYPVRFK